jgi:hypothetical protein
MPEEGLGIWGIVIFLVAIFTIMYFLMIRPRQKQQKEHEEMIKGGNMEKANAPLELKWDGRVRSARELFRTLSDFLNKYGYENKYNPLKEESGAIEGTAIFSDNLRGKKDYSIRNKGYFWAGIVLLIVSLIVVSIALIGGPEPIVAVVGLILLIVAVALVVSSKVKLRRYVKLQIEGETYLAKGKHLGQISSEVTDVVSNCRVTFTAMVGNPRKEEHLDGLEKLTRDTKEWEGLREEFDSLIADFERLRPKIELPRVEGESHNQNNREPQDKP